jgi:hypothetical protein
VSHQSGYVGSDVENFKLNSDGEGVPQSSNQSTDKSESHCLANLGAACANSKLIHVGDNSESYSDDNGTLFGSLGDNRCSEVKKMTLHVQLMRKTLLKYPSYH